MTIAAIVILLVLVIALAYECAELRERVGILEARSAEAIARPIIDVIERAVDIMVSEKIGGTDE